MRSLTAIPLAAVLAVAFATAATEAAPVGPELLFTNAAILSGGLDKCPTYNASTCTKGLAAFAARRRVLTAQGIKTLALPELQRYSVFSKMHPMDWGVNFHIFPKFNITTLISTTEFSTRHYAMSYQKHRDWEAIVDNYAFPIGHTMRHFFDGVYLDDVTKVQVLSARLLVTPIATIAAGVVDSILGARSLGQGFVTHAVVLVYDTTPAAMLEAMRVAATKVTTTLDLSPTAICRVGSKTNSVTRVNNTWLVEVKATADLMHRVRIHEDPSDATKAVNVSVITESLVLPSALIETDEYRRDQAVLKVEHDKAILNNPYMGAIAAPMPAPKTVVDGTICMVRECEAGNLFVDALRDAAGTDIGFFSGPWIIGSGWPQGNITLRDLYGTYPYTEQIATGRYLGVTLYELFNHTIAISSFDAQQSAILVEATQLMQISGIRFKYTLSRPRRDRLVSIDVLNKATGLYEPLERLKMYTVAFDSYLGSGGTIIKNYLHRGRYTGEVGSTRGAIDLHRSVGTYLRARNGAYVPGVSGRIVNVTGTANLASMASWNHKSGCAAGMVLNISIGTCAACPAGYQAAAGAAKCTLIPPPGPLLSAQAKLIVIVVAVVVALLLMAAAVKVFYIWRRYQRLRYCPRDAKAPIAAFFVTVRNEVALRERHPGAADAVLRTIERIVVEAVPRHQCYVARKLKAHFLVVAQEAAPAALCAAAIYRAVEAQQWADLIAAEERTAHVKAPEEALRYARSRSYRRSRASQNHTSRSHSTTASSRPSLSPRGSKPNMSPRLSARHPAGAQRSSMALHSIADSKVETVASDDTGRRTARRPIEPAVSIGLAFGLSAIEYDEDVDVYSYRGPVLDAAVTVADMSQSGQVLATEPVVDAVCKGCDGSVEFEEFTVRCMACPLAGKDVDVALSQCNVVGCAQRTFEVKSSDSDDAAGALAAALETAAGGLTARRIGVVSWTVPALRGGKGVFRTRAEHLKASEEVLAALRDVCGKTDDLVGTADGVFTAVVNGSSARTAQVAVSTVELGRAGLAVLEDVTEHRAACGAAVGTSVTGSLSDTVLIAGVVAERARLLATAAFHHPARPGLLVAEDTTPELEGRYALAAIDVISWPVQCGCVASHRTVANPLTFVLFAVEEAMKASDDEWLYQLEAAANGNPHTAMNNRLLAALGRATVEEAKSTKSPATSRTPDGPLVIAPGDGFSVAGLVQQIADAVVHPDSPLPTLSTDTASSLETGTTTTTVATTPIELFSQRRTIALCYPFQAPALK